MGYIQELRKLAGNKPLIMAGAGVLIFDAQDRLLLLRRMDNGLWGIPGGAMEPGESLEETAARETREETNLEVGKLTLFGVFSGPEFFYCYPNGAQVYNVSVVYIAQQVRGEIRLQDQEHFAYQFFDLQRLPEEISPPVKPILSEFVRHKQSFSVDGQNT